MSYYFNILLSTYYVLDNLLGIQHLLSTLIRLSVCKAVLHSLVVIEIVSPGHKGSELSGFTLHSERLLPTSTLGVNDGAMHFDTNYLQLDQTSQVKSSFLHKTPLTIDTSLKLPILTDQLQMCGSYPLLRFDMLEQLTKLRKVLYL